MDGQARTLLLWLVATAVAVGVAVTAVGLATGRVRPAPATVELVTTSQAGGPADGTGASATPDGDVGPSATTGPVAGSGTATPPSPPPEAPPSDGATPAATPTPDPTPTPTPTPSPDPTAPPSTAEQVRTATAIGGSARFRSVDGRVELVFATPVQGFQVRVEDDGGREVRVELVAADHTSRIDAQLEDGVLEVEVDERPED